MILIYGLVNFKIKKYLRLTPFSYIHRSLAEFWHWFVANVPGNSVGEGEEIFQLLHPLVLPEGNGGHRYTIIEMCIKSNLSKCFML